MLTTFHLLEKRNVYASLLTGGMKRKVSIIIALIGGSKVREYIYIYKYIDLYRYRYEGEGTGKEKKKRISNEV